MNNFSIVLVITALATMFAPAVSAQVPDEDMERYINEIRTYKHDYLARELNLSGDTEREFFEVYDELEDSLIVINAETRDIERSVIDNPDASDTEVEAALDAIYGQKAREAAVEESYNRRIAEIITPRQMLRLRYAERRFNQQLVRRHSRHAGRAPR